MLKTTELAYLTACASDLYDWTRDVSPLEEKKVFGIEHQNDAEMIASWLAVNSLDLLEQGCNSGTDRPQTTLAQMSVRMAAQRDRIPVLGDLSPEDLDGDERAFDTPMDALGCFEAETRFTHSLSKQEDGQRESNPACIIPDTTGQPIAYQKGNGKPTAMVWRDGYISTADGPRWVPKDAIIRPTYEAGHDPRAVAVSAGLLVLESPRIQTAHFLRFAVGSWLPERIAYEVLQQASGRVEQAVSDRDIALGAKLSGERLQQRVLPLLA